MLVVDASGAIAASVPEQQTAWAQGVIAQVAIEGATVPGHWWIEVGNGLLVAVRRGRIDAAAQSGALIWLRTLSIVMDPLSADAAWRDVLVLANRHRLN